MLPATLRRWVAFVAAKAKSIDEQIGPLFDRSPALFTCMEIAEFPQVVCGPKLATVCMQTRLIQRGRRLCV